MTLNNLITRLLFYTLLFAAIPVKSQWIQMQGPDGCNNLQMAKINNDLWTCTFNGVFTSQDMGLNWEQHPVFNNFQVTNCIAQYGDTIYVCAQQLTGNGHRTRFYTSPDSGKNWTSIELNENLNYPTIVPNIPQRIFRIGDVLFIVAQDFLLRSIDFGAHWETVLGGGGGGYVRYGWDDQRILCASQFQIAMSDNAGFDWKHLFGNNLSVFGNPQVQGDSLFIPRSDSIFTSTNGGQSWFAQTTANLPFLVYGTYFWKDDDAVLYAIYDFNIYQSPDFGHSWALLNNTPIPVNIYRTEALVDGNTIIMPTETGIFRSADKGSTWSRSDRGIFATHVNGIYDNGQTLFVNSFSELFRFEGPGQEWTNVFRCENFGSYCMPGFGFYQDEVYAVSNNGVFYSSDLGDHFNKITDAPINPAFPFINGRMIGNTFYYLDASKVATFKNGVFQDSLSFGLEASGGAMDFYNMDGRYVVVPAYGNPGRILYSDDQGANWQTGDSIQLSYSRFYRTGDRLFLSGDHLYYSDDKGKTWLEASVSTPDPNGARLIDICQYGARMFAARDVTWQGQIFFSEDMGLSWKIFDTPFDPIQKIGAVHVFGDQLHAGVLSSGVWRSSLTVSAPEPLLARQAETLIISPNPAGNIATIRWQTPLSAPGLLDIRANDGRLLRQIRVDSGVTGIEIPVAGFSPGVYLLHLQTGHTRLNGRLLRY